MERATKIYQLLRVDTWCLHICTSMYVCTCYMLYMNRYIVKNQSIGYRMMGYMGYSWINMIGMVALGNILILCMSKTGFANWRLSMYIYVQHIYGCM